MRTGTHISRDPRFIMSCECDYRIPDVDHHHAHINITYTQDHHRRHLDGVTLTFICLLAGDAYLFYWDWTTPALLVSLGLDYRNASAEIWSGKTFDKERSEQMTSRSMGW